MDMELGTNWWLRELEYELIPAGELMLPCRLTKFVNQLASWSSHGMCTRGGMKQMMVY